MRVRDMIVEGWIIYHVMELFLYVVDPTNTGLDKFTDRSIGRPRSILLTDRGLGVL